MTKAAKIFMLLPVLAGAACSHNSEEPAAESTQLAIAFNNAAIEAEQTSRAETNLSTQCNSFVVYGVKIMPGPETQTVMGGYSVVYSDGSANTTITNTNGWEYVGINGQTIKYWDRTASEYRFFAVAPAAGVTFTLYDNDSKVKAEFAADAQSATPDVYYSKLWSSTISASWGTIPVKLIFQQPYSKVMFSFINADGEPFTVDPSTGVTNESTPRTIQNIKFYPTASATRIVTKGTISLSYPISGAATDPVFSATPQDGTGYNELTLPNNLYAVFPMTGQADYEVSLDIVETDQHLVARIPAEYMNWLPNTRYNYLLKITDKSMEFIKVVQVASTTWTEQDGNHEIYNW